MAVRTLFNDVHFRNMYCSHILFKRLIKTDAGDKGKISIIKKKFSDNMDKSFEILEVKDSASVLRQWNWENKFLFGEIISIVKKTCTSITKIKKSKKVHKNTKKMAEIISSECSVPIKDVKPNLLSNENMLNSVTEYKFPENIFQIPASNIACSNIVPSILNFPMINIKNSNQFKDDKNLIDSLNYLRQHLSSLCGSDSYPSITSILEKTMPPERVAILERWKSDMIKKLGLESFKQYQQDLLMNGSTLHESINMYLSGVPEEELVVQPANVGHWESLKKLFPFIEDVKLLEEHVTHPFLCYRGVVDCFGSYNGNFVVIDWKTSKKFKPSLSSTFDGPLQVAAYAGALNFDERLNYKANKGLIVVAYESGNGASAHYMDEKTLQNYWNLWLKRLKNYWENIENSKLDMRMHQKN